MKSLNDIKQLVKNTKIKPTSEMRSKVLDEALKLQRNQNQQGISDTHIWRIIVKSKITKFAAAAVVIVAVLIGINQFGGSIDGTSVAWADIINQIVVAETAAFDLLIEKDGEIASLFLRFQLDGIIVPVYVNYIDLEHLTSSYTRFG